MPHNVKTLINNVTIAVVGAPPLSIPTAQTTVTLDDVSFSLIPASAFASSTTSPTEITGGVQPNTPYQGLYYSNTGSHSAYLQDLGTTTGAVSTQANFVSQDAAMTASVVSTANATDLASSEALANALKTAFNLLLADVTALRTTVNNELTALQTAGGPQKSS